MSQARYGDWRELFRNVDRIDAVTKADIRRVANQIFVPTNRTVGIIETMPQSSRKEASNEANPDHCSSDFTLRVMGRRPGPTGSRFRFPNYTSSSRSSLNGFSFPTAW